MEECTAELQVLSRASLSATRHDDAAERSFVDRRLFNGSASVPAAQRRQHASEMIAVLHLMRRCDDQVWTATPNLLAKWDSTALTHRRRRPSEALALSGRHDEAHRAFTAMTDHAGALGIYAEEIDPETGDQLGNIPQAFTHIGLINAALRLEGTTGKDARRPSSRGATKP